MKTLKFLLVTDRNTVTDPTTSAVCPPDNGHFTASKDFGVDPSTSDTKVVLSFQTEKTIEDLHECEFVCDSSKDADLRK